MVMFKEDDERIKAAQKAARKQRPALRLFVRIVLIGAIVIGLSLAVLSALGGPHDALKKGLEDYISQATGLQAEIGTFNNMSFFPLLSIDAADIKLKNISGEGEEKTEKTAARIDGAVASMRFFDTVFSRGQMLTLDLSGIHADAGVFTGRALALDHISIKDDGDSGKPALVAQGNYGGKTLHLVMGMDRKERGNRVYYKIPKNQNIILQAGPLHATGDVTRTLGGIRINAEKASVDGYDREFSGVLTLGSLSNKDSYVGEVTAGESAFSFVIKKRRDVHVGDIVFDVLGVDDVTALQAFSEAVQLLVSSGGDLVLTPDEKYDLNIDIKKLAKKGANLGHLDGRLHIADGIARLDPVNGEFSGGKVDGNAVLTAKTSPAKLESKLSVDNLRYGELQKALHGYEKVTGTANIEAALTGSGRDFNAILRDLDGNITMIAAEGKMESAAMLNLWGTGLFNVMLPKLGPSDETVLNCMIADFKVENGNAEAQTLLIDTKRVTITGKGGFNIPDQTIDLKLEPESKDTALLSVATAVRVKGPLAAPSIAPDGMSLFEKLGTLALGTVNPLFWAYSLTDLGLTEGHPCHKYIGNQSE